jgi:SWIM zinc finger
MKNTLATTKTNNRLATKTNKTPTWAFENAHEKATKQAGLYSIEFIENTGLWLVTSKADCLTQYAVDAHENHCTCPAYRKHGICKHLIMVQNEMFPADYFDAEAEETERIEILCHQYDLVHANAAAGLPDFHQYA